VRPTAVRSLLAYVATAALVSGLFAVAPTAPPASATAVSNRPTNPRTGLPAGMTATHRQLVRARAATTTTATTTPPVQLNYYDGPVVSNPSVYSVLWGGDDSAYLPEVAGSTTPDMDTFFGQVTHSSYISLLAQYGTQRAGGTDQSIGYGSFTGRSKITPAASAAGTTVTDAQIQSELADQVNARHLPSPAVDAAGYTRTIYALFFPNGTTICDGTDCSGHAFCAYHNSFTATVDGVTRTLLYMVLPDDTDQSMLLGCNSNTATTSIQVLQSYTSHELSETITDPDVGLATTDDAAPLGWYDQNYGEVADICNDLLSGNADGTLTGTDGATYVVQKVWSNHDGACLTDDSSTPPAPAIGAASALPGGRVRLTWTPPEIDGGSPVSEYEIYQSTSKDALGSKVGSVPAPGVQWTSAALTSGTQYYFHVFSHNKNGDSAGPSAEAVATPDATAPHVTITSPTRLFQLSNRITLSYTASDADSPTGITYDVQSRTAASNAGFGSYTDLAHTTTARSLSRTGSPGHEYCFRVRARDAVGNVSPWTPDRCTVVPLDDRAMASITSGWTRTTASAAYRGTLTKTHTAGARLRLTHAQADRIALVVTTCSSCGRFAIYLNGSLWRTVDTHSAATHYRTIVLPGTFRLGTKTIVLKSLTRYLLLDAIGIART